MVRQKSYLRGNVVPESTDFSGIEPTHNGDSTPPKKAVVPMGTITVRTRKDDSKAYTAQIVIKQNGVTVHREAQTFDRKQAANAWIVRREAELKSPGGLERKEDPTLGAVIDRYIEESRNPIAGTRAQVLKAIKNSDLGETKCSEITPNTLVTFARE